MGTQGLGFKSGLGLKLPYYGYMIRNNEVSILLFRIVVHRWILI